jgi:hypothetical protein
MAPTTGASRDDAGIQKSLGLGALVQQLQPDRKYTILDLGPAMGANLEFWSQYPCKIHLADFAGILNSGALDEDEDQEEEEEEEDPRLFDWILPFDAEVRFDIILCWDFFNYIKLNKVTLLVRHLSRFCTSGTLLFALLSSAQKMPAKPTVYKILDPERIQYMAQTGSLVDSPRYNPRDINKMMVGFEVSNSFLLRNGIQEYLFVYEGEG